MWRVVPRDVPVSPDPKHFVERLNEHAGFFAPAAPVWAARAPLPLDVMGGIADYSRPLVLQLPLAVATFAAVQPVDESS